MQVAGQSEGRFSGWSWDLALIASVRDWEGGIGWGDTQTLCAVPHCLSANIRHGGAGRKAKAKTPRSTGKPKLQGAAHIGTHGRLHGPFWLEPYVRDVTESVFDSFWVDGLGTMACLVATTGSSGVSFCFNLVLFFFIFVPIST